MTREEFNKFVNNTRIAFKCDMCVDESLRVCEGCNFEVTNEAWANISPSCDCKKL
jgi:hypothetical protein